MVCKEIIFKHEEVSFDLRDAAGFAAYEFIERRLLVTKFDSLGSNGKPPSTFVRKFLLVLFNQNQFFGCN